MDRDFYSFVRLSDLNLNVTFRISSLQGKLDRISRTQLLRQPEARQWGAQQSDYPDLLVECCLFADNKPLSVLVKTAYRPFRNNHQWNEWITLPYKLCDLPLGAQLAFTIYDVASSRSARVIGGTTFPLFSKKGTLKSAQHRLFVWKGARADGSVETATPSKVGEMKDEMGRLEKVIKRHERGDLPRVDWLDKLAYRQVEKVYQAESQSSDRLFLYIDLPRFELPVVFCEAESMLPSATASNGLAPLAGTSMGSNAGPSGLSVAGGGHDVGSAASQAGSSSAGTAASGNPTTAAAAAAAAAAALSTADPNRITSSLFTIFDPEISRSNPVEAKHRRLVRSHRSGPLDRELKPSAEVRDELNEILSYPPTRVLTPSEMDRVWSFRFYLTRDPKGLTKFLKSVVWTDQGEAKQATEILLPMWTEPGLDDALELLGPTFQDARVRSYAVRQLERAEDEELILYLLQLVQALKFEKPLARTTGALAGSATGDFDGDTRRGTSARQTVGSSSNSLSDDAAGQDASGLADFLIRRGLSNPALGNNLYWYLEVECEDPRPARCSRRSSSTTWIALATAHGSSAPGNADPAGDSAGDAFQTGQGAPVEPRRAAKEDREAACAHRGSEEWAEPLRAATDAATGRLGVGQRHCRREEHDLQEQSLPAPARVHHRQSNQHHLQLGGSRRAQQRTSGQHHCQSDRGRHRR